MNDNLPTPPISRKTFWFSILAAPLAWLIQEISSWLLLLRSCSARTAPDETSLLLTLSLISVVAFTLASIAFSISIHLFRNHQDEAPHHLTGMNLSAFQAAVGLLINTVFLLAIFWATWPLFMLPLCEAAR